MFTAELIYCPRNIFPLLTCLPQPGERISDLLMVQHIKSFFVDLYLVRCITAVALAVAVLFNTKLIIPI